MSNTIPLPERKMAPVQGWPQGIPWSLHLEAYAAYCKKWSPQPALIEGWCRGGFGTKELDELIPGWRERASEIAQLRGELAHAAAVCADRDARIKALENALRDTLDFVERHSHRWDGLSGKHPFLIVEAARATLGDSATTPQPPSSWGGQSLG